MESSIPSPPGPVNLWRYAWRRLAASWRRSGLILLVGVIWLAVEALRMRGGLEGQLGRWEVLRNAASLYWMALPLLVASAIGIDIAADRQGWLNLVRVRGVGLSAWVFATTIVSAVWTAVLSVVPLLVSAVIVVLTAPAVGTSSNGELPAAFGGGLPLPWLVATTVLGSISFAVITAAIAMWSANAYLAVTVPIVLVTTLNVGPPSSLDAFKPSTNLALSAGSAITPGFVVGYWALATLLGAVAVVGWVRWAGR